MPEFLIAPFTASAPIAPLEVFVRLLIALVFGGGVSWIYRATRPAAGILPSFPPTLVLMAVLIAMVTQVVGDSVARAFSLVGALSIVRFRTVVRDTQDTAFVIFSVVVGMACGASDPRLALIGMGIVGVAAFVMRTRASGPRVASSEPYMLDLRLGAKAELEATVGATLDAHLLGRQLASVSTARQGTAVDATYVIRFRPDRSIDELVRALNALDAVIGVEVRMRSTETNGDDDD
jgi:hypothetical protein